MSIIYIKISRFLCNIFLFFVISGWLFAVSPARAGTATLSWSPVSEDTSGHPESQPLYYNIHCDTLPAFVPSSANFLAATLSTQYVHTDARLDDPTVHLYYVVYAVDMYGNRSAPSDTVGESSYVLANVRILLEAPYDAAGDTMSTRLRDSAILSLSSPYYLAPRRVTALPANVTDWVLLQLRDPISATIVAEESFFVNKYGMVTELDGINAQLGFTGCAPGDYQVIVRHRNHVAVMSRPTISFSEKSAALYDFTTDSTRYYGNSAAKLLRQGIWGLWCGDMNQDGMVTDIDYAWWLDDAQTGRTGYRPADLNFDNACTTADYLLWYKTRRSGIYSHVP